MVFHDSRSIFVVFHGSKLVVMVSGGFHGFSWFQVGFYVFFMVQVGFSWFQIGFSF